jgi:hypothetical protein
MSLESAPIRENRRVSDKDRPFTRGAETPHCQKGGTYDNREKPRALGWL